MATSGGTKAYFNKRPEWKLVYEKMNVDTNVLERVVFEREYDSCKGYFVPDAYHRDCMQETVNDFLAAISVNRSQQIMLKDNTTLFIADSADLIMFNGHNGVMDNIEIGSWINLSNKRTDVVMNACVSYGYLQKEFMLAGGYPLVRTNSLLYPGAYVLEQIISDRVEGENEDQICLNAGRIYCDKHDCGKGAHVYSSG